MAEILSKTKDAAKKFAINNFKFLSRWLIRFLKHHDLALRRMIANMDETPVWFDMAESLTVDSKGTKQSMSEQQAMIKIDLLKFWPVNTPLPLAGVVVWFKNKGWMNEPGMQKQITYWNSQQSGSCNFHSRSTDLADRLCKLWHGLMANSGNGLTKGGNLKRADLSTVCYWVLNTWNDIPEDIIVRVFKKCSISNCLSGSKDHLIYNDDEGDSNKSDEYDEDEEFDEDYEFMEGEFDEGNEDNDSNEYNKYPECFIVIEDMNIER
ncbi:hypothetical protein C2G38_2166545 [Gigaspora rosea]|uniref:DDE-1 domain-containing protein n=1 Tax=Gigaspora rosea TaxID=44941 RepID=A0A397VRL2_9GLOM|nr:hypothetical protein C2G38_2166545 [Gigaspora rosea]